MCSALFSSSRRLLILYVSYFCKVKFKHPSSQSSRDRWRKGSSPTGLLGSNETRFAHCEVETSKGNIGADQSSSSPSIIQATLAFLQAWHLHRFGSTLAIICASARLAWIQSELSSPTNAYLEWNPLAIDDIHGVTYGIGSSSIWHSRYIQGSNPNAMCFKGTVKSHEEGKMQ